VPPRQPSLLTRSVGRNAVAGAGLGQRAA
jgi:hypothetical protein